MADVNVFVAARGQGVHTALAGWIVEAARLTGHAATVVHERLPLAGRAANLVVAPHEFFAASSADRADLQRAAACSVPICTAEPATPQFQLSLDAARLAPVAYDLNVASADALRAAGVDVHHLQLGAVPSMTVPSQGRPTEVVSLGRLDSRRARTLADCAGSLYRRTVELRFIEATPPAHASSPDPTAGRRACELLARSQTLLDIRREAAAPGWIAWPRIVMAMANRCVVVTDAGTGAGMGRLQPDVHFVAVATDRLADELDALLADEARRRRIADAAFDLVTGPLALRHSVDALLDRLDSAQVSTARRASSRFDRWGFVDPATEPPVRLPPFKPHLEFQRQAKRVAMAENDAQRRLDAAECVLRHGARQHIEIVQTPSFAKATPEVSVVVSVYDYAGVVADTLRSVAASEGIDFEVIVVDDHSTDHGRQVVADLLADVPDVPMALHAKDANEGLAAARNTAFEAARADLVMVLDADNQIYPTCLRTLADALNDDRGADAAYAILEDFGAQRGLRSAFEWDVARLCSSNYIDAQAMIRRTAWDRLGGYRHDEEAVYGWEDWDLWLRLAASGGRALLVPRILGRYRVQPGSMIALTNLAADDATLALRNRYPGLPWPRATALAS